MKKICLAAFILFFTAAPALAAFQSDQWQYFKDFSVPKDGFILINTDEDILGHSRKGLPDIRLLAEDGREIPYQVVGNNSPKEEFYPATIINQVTREGFSSVTLDLSKSGLLHNHISLEIESNEHFLGDVLLEGSNDNRTWNTVISNDKLFIVPPDIKKKELAYTPATYRYMRLTVDFRGNKPLYIAGSKVKYSPPVENPVPGLLPQMQTVHRTDPKKNTTEIIIDLYMGGYQVDCIDLLTSSENFNRMVEIYQSDDAKEWHLLASDRIYQYRWEGYQSQNSSIKLDLAAGRYIKAVVYNHDSSALDIQAKVYGGPPKLLTSLSAGKYRLWYGNLRGDEPQYDISRFSHLINLGSLETVSLSLEQVNPFYKQIISPKTARLLLNAAVILSAVVIGLIIFKNMRSRS